MVSDRFIRFLIEEAPETLERLMKVCPECHGNPLISDGHEVVCSHCGYVVETVPDMKHTLPFDVQFAPTARISHGSSLGGTLPLGNLSQVLSRTPEQYGLTKQDLDFIYELVSRVNRREKVTRDEVNEGIMRYLRKIELTHIRTQVQSVECPQAMKIKTEITAVLQDSGLFSGKEYNEFHHQLGDRAGIIASVLGRFIEAGFSRPIASYRKLATAIVIFLLEKTPAKERYYETILENEDLDPADMNLLDCLSHCPLLKDNIFQLNQND